jgi:hypothetical protein
MVCCDQSRVRWNGLLLLNWLYAMSKAYTGKCYFQRGWVRMVWNRECSCAWGVVRDAQQEELSKCEQLTSEVYKNLEDLHEHTTKLFQLKVDREALISKFPRTPSFILPFPVHLAPLRGFIWTHTTICHECSRDCTEANWELGVDVRRYHRQIESQEAKSEVVVWSYGMVQTTTESALWVLWW